MKRAVVVDIETDGLLDQLTMMSVAWTYSMDDEAWLEWREHQTNELVDYLNTFDVMVAHNGCGFDRPALTKLTGMELTPTLFDTMVAARLRHPDIMGGHSLKAWGKRLGVLKGQVVEEDDDAGQVFGTYTPELSQYCKDDVQVTIALLERLQRQFDIFDLPTYYFIELSTAMLMDRQERHGVRFDIPRAGFLVHVLTEEILKVDNEAIPQLPLMMHTAEAYAKPFLLSGKLAKWPAMYCDTHGIPHEKVGGPFSRIWFTPFDMGKTDKVKRVLIDNGWVPTEWNEKKLEDEGENKYAWVSNYIEKNFIQETNVHWRNALLNALNYQGPRNRAALYEFLLGKRFVVTSPKITEDSLDSVDGNVGLLVKRRVMLAHRRSLVQGLLDRRREDGKLGAGCNPCATPTFRANYRTVVNIPAARSDYGKECRSLFIPDSSDHLIVGSDAAGLEARMLCHYMDDPNYTDMLLNGDIHTYNQELAQLPTRDHAKTFLYALLYGAGDLNLGKQLGGGKKEGAAARALFMEGLPKYAQLINRLQKEAESGFIEGLDGRPIRLRRGSDGQVQTHKALNTLLQSAGAIVMKYSMEWMDKEIQRLGLRAHQILWMHDECQWSVHKQDVEQVVGLAGQWVTQAGILLNLNIPLASDPKVGRNWYETH